MPIAEPYGMRQQGGNGVRTYESACMSCPETITVRLGVPSTTEAQDGSRGSVTYADADLAVWDCPSCGATNADAFNE
jgi:hypothetical protein